MASPTPTPSPAPSPSLPAARWPSAPDRAGRRARMLGQLALIGSVLAALVAGLTLGPMEARHGRHLGDTPGSCQALLLALGAALLLCLVLGVIALVLGVLSLSRRGRSGAAITGILCGVLAPVAALGALIGALALGALLI